MPPQIFFIFHIIIYFLNYEVNGNCVLHENLIRNEWRLALQYENQNLQLLRETNIKNGTILYMICNNNDITKVICENDQFNPSLPLSVCANKLRPQLKLENNATLCPFNLYRLGFQLQCNNNNYFFETYKVCFDFAHMRAVFTINEAYPFVLRRPYGIQFDPDEIFTMYIFSAYNKRDIYERFQGTLGASQGFMSNNAGNERFDRGHLTPVADYMMNPLIATTFKMVNVIPQFHTINDGNWKTMEEWARNPMNTPSKVCSGAFDFVLNLPDTQGNLKAMYLRENNLIPIPLWTYKIVLNRHGIRTVFVQYNNIHDKSMPPALSQEICKQIECPTSIYLRKSNYYGYTYCCEPNHFMKSTVPNLQGYC